MIHHRSILLTVVLGLFAALLLRADDASPKLSEDQMAAIAAGLKWQTGTIDLKNGLAKITLTDNFRFLDHENAEKVLHDLWGNPPDDSELGMIFPADKGPLDHGTWGIMISYEAGGYVKDDDADKINYTDLLKQMQTAVHEQNEARAKEGYPTMELIGWAAPPRYDKATHKLYWAKELNVGGYSQNTLNYNIRILGRRGVLVLNAIAPMRDFVEIDGKIPEVLPMVDFEQGNTYADFDPKIDKIAEYGLATLVAGGALGAAAKLGLFGVILKYGLAAVLALKKLVIVIVVAVVAGFKKLMAKLTGKSSSTPEHLLPPQNQGTPTPITPVVNPPVPPTRQVDPPPNIPPGPLG
jgi:uncharacterized membrane-anchored protein